MATGVRDTRAGFGVLGAVAALALTSCSGHAGESGCVRPTLSVDSSEVSRGGPLTIHGSGFYSVCNDTDDPPDDARGGPAPDQVRVRLVQAGTTTDLGVVTADAHGAFDLAATVPATADPGAARVDTTWAGAGSVAITVQ